MDALTIPPHLEARIAARERRKLLAIAYYISGGIGAVMAAFWLLYALVLGAVATTLPGIAQDAAAPTRAIHATAAPAEASATPSPTLRSHRSAEPPVFMFKMMTAVMGGIGAGALLLSALTGFAGYCVSRRKYKVLIYIVGCLNIIWIPYGTILGLWTILALSSEAGREEFGHGKA